MCQTPPEHFVFIAAQARNQIRIAQKHQEHVEREGLIVHLHPKQQNLENSQIWRHLERIQTRNYQK